MNNQAHAQEINSNILPEDRSVALNLLIRLTQNLSKLADREATALAQNDMLAFSILQDEKAIVAQQYMGASEELRSNINTYRGADPALLDRLEQLQNDLGEKTQSNNDVVHRVYEQAQTRTQSALITAQELGQDRCIRFEPTSDATNENQTSTQRAGV